MTASSDTRTVNDAFFQPITALVADSPHTRPCPELPDLNFVHLGIHRVLESSPSGRGFLQELSLIHISEPTRPYTAACRTGWPTFRNCIRTTGSAIGTGTGTIPAITASNRTVG